MEEDVTRDNVIVLDDYRNAPEDRACPHCESVWWTVKGVVLSMEGRVVGYAYPVKCSECGYELDVVNV